VADQGHELVLRLAGRRYAVHGEFGPGRVAESHFLKGFSIAVNDALAVMKASPGKAKPNGKSK